MVASIAGVCGSPHALAGSLAHAASTPSEADAEELVHELASLVEQGELNRAWLQQHVERCDPGRWGEAVARANTDSVMDELALGSALHRGLVSGVNGVLGTVEGPDYLRVVLEGSPWTTVVVSGTDEPRIRTVEVSTCGLCAEPERFVRDLLVDVRSRGSGAHRLLPGLELEVGSLLEENPERASDWLAAWQARNVTAGYTRWLLENAHVEGSQGSVVEMAWVDGSEQWPLVYSQGRWCVDHGGLDAQSRLKLSWEDLDLWLDASHLESARAKWWLPRWREQGKKTLIAEDVLFAAPRPVQGDLLVYGHDVGRRFAQLALLDAETGEVLKAFELPRLPERLYMPLDSWRGLFRFALSPTGTLFAIAAHDRVWVVEPGTGEVVYTRQGLLGAGALAFSLDGKTLAVADRYKGGVRLLDVQESFEELDQARVSRNNVQSILASEEGWWLVLVNGRIRQVALRDLSSVIGLERQVCCGKPALVARHYRSGGLVVACSEPCDGETLWMWDALDGSDPVALGGLEHLSYLGPMAVDHSGSWLVTPSMDGGHNATLLSLDAPTKRISFGEQRLLQVAWDPTSEIVWGVDVLGRAWKWSVGGQVLSQDPALELRGP